MKEKLFYVLIKNAWSDFVVRKKGPYDEHKANQIARGMDINMSEDYYTCVQEEGDNDPL